MAGDILTTMHASGEYGEFFPPGLSPFGYNEANAAEFYPLQESQVRERGWQWREARPTTIGKETLQSQNIADDIRDVPDTITHEILACTECRRNYRIVIQELEFYRNLGLPIPRTCPDCRNRERLARRNPCALFHRTCAQCGKGMETTYSPDRPEIVFCEECYLKAIY